MGKNINIIALDKNGNTLTLINYSNLQWTRNWHEPGKFSLQCPLSQYNKNIRYLYTKDRPEMGEVSQVNYYIKNGVKSVNLSGYFVENKLNNMICYQNAQYKNITNAPAWIMATGKAESVAHQFFNAFKRLEYTQNGVAIVSDLGINALSNQNRGHNAEHQRLNQYLGKKIYTILKPSNMSYRVAYDFASNSMNWGCIKGVDRTFGNDELNNPIIFSTKYGNVNNVDLLMSDTDYKQSFLSQASNNVDGVESVYLYAGHIRAEGESIKDDRYIYYSSGIGRSDYSSEAEYISGIIEAGNEEIVKNTKKISLDFDAIIGSYDYLTDFDIGDICSVEIPELGLSEDAVITSCIEVLKKGTYKLTLELTV